MYFYFFFISDSKASAKQELAERTEAPHDVASVIEDSGKRERKLTSKMEASLEKSKVKMIKLL